MTIKPNWLDLIGGVVLLSLLVLGASWMLGLLALALVREPPPGWAVAVVLAGFAAWSFGFTHIANLCVFRVRLSDDSVQIRGVLRDRRIRVADMGEMYFAENWKYAHIILSVGSGSASMSSLLWSRKAFRNLMADVSSWAARLGRPAPVNVDTVNPGSDETSKRAAKKLKFAFRRDWAAYALFLAFLVLCSALIQAVLPARFSLLHQQLVAPLSPTPASSAALADPIAELFPAAAKAKAIGGVTKMKCVAQADGSLSECAIVSECPAGLGFGEAALKIARHYKLGLKTRGGRAVASDVIIPIVWRVEGVEPPAECLPPSPVSPKP